MNFTIKQKLIGSFLIISIIFGLSSFLSYKNMKETNESYDYLVGTVSELRSIAQSMQTNSALQIGYYRAFMLYEDTTYKEQMNTANERIITLVEEGKQLSTLEETRDRLDSIEQLNKEFIELSNQVMDNMSIDKENALTQGLNEIPPITTSLTDEVTSLHDWLKEDILSVQVNQTQQDSQSGLIQVVVISVIATLIAIGAGIIISIYISRPIVKLGNKAKQVAAGDLNTEELRIKSKDEIFYLNQSFEQMTTNLREMISGIARNSDQVAVSAEQLNASAEQSSKATESVSSSIQEVASSAEFTTSKLESNSRSLEEVLQGVTQIANSSTMVSELSKQTTVEAEEGDKFVNDNLQQMRFIRESVSKSNEVIGTLSERSKEIGNILNVINDIAEQTNLLALNAAIEAARAGEHGKGFAVVADEVRKLAEQSQDSTKNIAELIAVIQKDTEESVKMMGEVMTNAENGVKVSQQTSDKFAQILNSTRNITPQIEDVTATVQQISASIEEVSTSAREVSEQAQTNAASSEEVAASTEEQLASMQEISASAEALASMAEDLQEVVNRFNY
ncbi:methyl-accepting chemotaxis protein [Aquibacillus rhizosphaerae]|uniref:Methyl-accepting chemotaxis protein n=1 Tax=Aquibacillus rhizosphaerae TaxID=3051431 RepID=A0ABT7L560_9BACI|nr:methyl-accepting chemotaxis protein [Aquibacillus sp. LR5S19]MDL4840991.1 methyl-accepting chemotaxis protein [Aquibacillus sp. LR5S19]